MSRHGASARGGSQRKSQHIPLAGAAALQARALPDSRKHADPDGAAAAARVSAATWPLFGQIGQFSRLFAALLGHGGYRLTEECSSMTLALKAHAERMQKKRVAACEPVPSSAPRN